jgi:hypothetical protein
MFNKIVRTSHGCITTNLNQSVLQCNGNIPVHIQPKSLSCAISWDSYGYCVFRSQGVLLSHFQKRYENVNSASYS